MTLSAGMSPVMTSTQLLEHWQGHRRLTRRVIEAFPDDKLFSYSVGGMRPFARSPRNAWAWRFRRCTA